MDVPTLAIWTRRQLRKLRDSHARCNKPCYGVVDTFPTDSNQANTKYLRRDSPNQILGLSRTNDSNKQDQTHTYSSAPSTKVHPDVRGCPVVGDMDPTPASQTTGQPRLMRYTALLCSGHFSCAGLHTPRPNTCGETVPDNLCPQLRFFPLPSPFFCYAVWHVRQVVAKRMRR